jgi:hypothetical protein
MKQPPSQDRRSHQQQPEDLIAAVNAGLFRSPRRLGNLLQVRLNASLDHGWALL